MPKRRPLKSVDAKGTKRLHSFWQPPCSPGERSPEPSISTGSQPLESTKDSFPAESVPDNEPSTPSGSQPSKDSSALKANQASSLHGTKPDIGMRTQGSSTLGSSKLLSQEDMYCLITEHWTPPEDYEFPVTSVAAHSRRCQGKWLKAYPWLAYSPSEDGLYCKHCKLFATGNIPAGQLVTCAFRNWKKALLKFKEHSTWKYHQDALARSENFLQTMRKPEACVNTKLQAQSEERIAFNRKILSSVVETVLLCGRQGFAYRSSRDDGVLEDENTSNFNALLQFRIQSGDRDLEQHLKTCDPRATYVSKNTQNRIIDIIAEHITANLLKEVREAKYFSVLADEVTDVSNWEQLSIVLRFVDSNSSIREEFLSFVACHNITGETIANNILQSLESWGLNVQDLRGQGYDGAANMSGKFQGVQARIRQVNDKAIYIHCASHCLNLSVLKACSVPQILSIFSDLKEVSLFFASSPKRQRKLEEVIDSRAPNEKRKKLVDLCRTRWVERLAALDTFLDLYTLVCECLSQMVAEGGANWDADTLSRASGMLKSVQSSSFIVALVTAKNGLAYIKRPTVQLQKKASDIASAYEEIRDVISCLEGLRDSADDTFHDWFMQATELADAAGVSIQMPRQCNRQILRDNQPADNPEEYYRRSVGIPFLDCLLSQLNSRFGQSQVAANGLVIVPSTLLKSARQGFNPIPAGVSDLVTLWEGDMPSKDEIPAEWNRWVCKWQNATTEIPDTTTATLKACDKDMFPNINRLLVLICTIPITTAECERTISRLKMLKTCLRSSTGQDRLNGLALMRIHRDRPVDIGEVVNAFARKYRTRMALKTSELLSV